MIIKIDPHTLTVIVDLKKKKKKKSIYKKKNYIKNAMDYYFLLKMHKSNIVRAQFIKKEKSNFKRETIYRNCLILWKTTLNPKDS